MDVDHRHRSARIEGQALQSLGWMRRHGALGLILALPDGTRRLVPAAWTDVEPVVSPSAQPRETLGALADLLNAGRVLAALARRLENRPDDGGHLVVHFEIDDGQTTSTWRP